MENIYSWVATNIGPGIIVRMEFDPKILGGAVIAYGGKYFDGSLYKIVESKLQSSKESIIDRIVNFK
jgi:F0F1-type ATP synthase delta subunit